MSSSSFPHNASMDLLNTFGPGIGITPWARNEVNLHRPGMRLGKDVATAPIMTGLHSESFCDGLAMRMPQTFDKLLSGARRYRALEDLNRHHREDCSHGQSSHRNDQQGQGERDLNLAKNRTSREDRKGGREEPQPHFSTYTPLKSTFCFDRVKASSSLRISLQPPTPPEHVLTSQNYQIDHHPWFPPSSARAFAVAQLPTSASSTSAEQPCLRAEESDVGQPRLRTRESNVEQPHLQCQATKAAELLSSPRPVAVNVGHQYLGRGHAQARQWTCFLLGSRKRTGRAVAFHTMQGMDLLHAIRPGIGINTWAGHWHHPLGRA
ncbi:hypothetical protein Droror1_Dr00027875 [Drosera rotundifolia]